MMLLVVFIITITTSACFFGSLLIFLYGCHSVLWLYKLGLDGASIVPAWPALKLKSDYQHREQVHPGMFVCLETAGMHITQALQFQLRLMWTIM